MDGNWQDLADNIGMDADGFFVHLCWPARGFVPVDVREFTSQPEAVKLVFLTGR